MHWKTKDSEPFSPLYIRTGIYSNVNFQFNVVITVGRCFCHEICSSSSWGALSNLSKVSLFHLSGLHNSGFFFCPNKFYFLTYFSITEWQVGWTLFPKEEISASGALIFWESRSQMVSLSHWCVSFWSEKKKKTKHFLFLSPESDFLVYCLFFLWERSLVIFYSQSGSF